MGRLNPKTMCEGKRRFVGEIQARHVARQWHGYHGYLCPFCHFWHIGGETTTRAAFSRQSARARHEKGLAAVRKLLDEE